MGWTASVAVFLLCSLSLPAQAGEPIECSGEMNGVIPGDLVVPPGEFCIIIDANVLGSVEAQPGSHGFHAHDSTIDGDVRSAHSEGDIRVLDSGVQGDVVVTHSKAGTVGAICRSGIVGNVEITDGAGSMIVGNTGFGGVCTDNDYILGNVMIARNTGGEVVMRGELIKGSVGIIDNTSGTELVRSRIGGDLVCTGNVPPPTEGQNRVRGNRIGQCR